MKSPPQNELFRDIIGSPRGRGTLAFVVNEQGNLHFDRDGVFALLRTYIQKQNGLNRLLRKHTYEI